MNPTLPGSLEYRDIDSGKPSQVPDEMAGGSPDAAKRWQRLAPQFPVEVGLPRYNFQDWLSEQVIQTASVLVAHGTTAIVNTYRNLPQKFTRLTGVGILVPPAVIAGLTTTLVHAQRPVVVQPGILGTPDSPFELCQFLVPGDEFSISVNNVSGIGVQVQSVLLGWSGSWKGRIDHMSRSR
ncbi:MAG: hypothetical protein ABID40_04875 [Candidatus Bipolaricaulota bacterium]